MNDRFTLQCTIQYGDLVKILKAFGYEESAEIVADYLTENIEYTLDLSNYIWNVLPYNVETFSSKAEAIEHRNNNYDEKHWQNCKIYECEDGTAYFEEGR